MGNFYQEQKKWSHLVRIIARASPTDAEKARDPGPKKLSAQLKGLDTENLLRLKGGCFSLRQPSVFC